MGAPRWKIGLNPLPWVLTADGFTLSVQVLRAAFEEIKHTRFRFIHADPPAELSVEEYRALLAEYGLSPAPGYFSAIFEQNDRTGLLDAAKRHAAVQAQLGNTEVFVAGNTRGRRRDRPAIGYESSEQTLSAVIDGLGAAAEAITAEGVRPALHPHVASMIEVEDEVRAALDGIQDTILGFGPDTGHLAWAGIDPVAIMTDYADRIAAVHLKDVRLEQAAAAAAARVSYTGATRGPYHVWTEPGQGDVDLGGALAALPTGYAGWVIAEVDVPEAPSNLESTQRSANWLRDQVGDRPFEGGDLGSG